MLRAVILLIVLLTTFSHSQDVKISGKITGEKDEPLNGANVVIEGSIDGQQVIRPVIMNSKPQKPAARICFFTYYDYNDKRQTVVIEAGKNIELNIKLKKAEVPGKKITMMLRNTMNQR
jgi:hypothetical protein